MFPEQCGPGIGSEFIELHARERALVQDIGTVALVQFQKRIRHGADNLAGSQLDFRHAERWNLELVIYRELAPEITVFVLSDAFQ